MPDDPTSAMLRRLVEVVATLRAPGGCAWDRAQTPATMGRYVLEEAHEVVDAIERGAPPEAVRDELGDLLFLVVAVTQMHADAGGFDLADVARAAADKLVRRHPHVFGDGQPRPWAELKAEERGDDGPRSALDGVPLALSSLLRADLLGRKAAEVGFDWPDREGVRAKVTEELDELDEAIAQDDPEAIGEELGDLLFSLAQLGRFAPIAADDALRRATHKFERRFRAVEAACLLDGVTVSTSDPETLERRWARAKEQC